MGSSRPGTGSENVVRGDITNFRAGWQELEEKSGKGRLMGSPPPLKSQQGISKLGVLSIKHARSFCFKMKKKEKEKTEKRLLDLS